MSKWLVVFLALISFCVPAFAVDVAEWSKSKVLNHYGDENQITIVFQNIETGDEWTDSFSKNALLMWLETLESLRPDLDAKDVRDIKLKISGILMHYA